ncbi:hypothetical protein FN846DRAFT_787508 [Sphaerosporella brunnea]|uniref:U1-type domain-containing protein n=1 Tax=Sphaerosporella brunnea TaxID=1250544 RepID=A0A5J5EEC1_9PEZI|nr:hypothetical protein FN846DRAFT_787508 [Sphaerosporella brunnea]
MSEYWKSIPKYWCKHCKDFVTDTALGRKNHEATAKHQSALKRFLRDLHKDNERATAASEKAKREVARLNALVGDSSSAAAAGPAPSVAKPELKKGERWGVANRPLTAEEKKRQMKELEALGVAMPEEFRGDLALPGEWSVVSVEEAKPELSEKERVRLELAEARKKELEEAERKRKWDELDHDEKEIRSFKIQSRTYPGAKEEEEVDVDALFARRGKRLAKDTEKEEMNGTAVKKEPVDSSPGITVKTEEMEDTPIAIKKEENAPPAGDGVVFKKRKAKTMRKKD